MIYFEDHLKTDFINNAIRWILEDLNIYDPCSGVTNNIVESMHSLIKRLTDWKEKALDSIVLSFYHLQNYYVNELLRGFCGLGNLTLNIDTDQHKWTVIMLYFQLAFVTQMKSLN